MQTVEVLGQNLTFRTNPGGLNEAGVVWGPAVRALAAAVAPMLRRRVMVDGARRRRAGVLELGAGTGALGIALAGEGAVYRSSFLIFPFLFRPVVYSFTHYFVHHFMYAYRVPTPSSRNSSPEKPRRDT